jgi:hypothetical protein
MKRALKLASRLKVRGSIASFVVGLLLSNVIEISSAATAKCERYQNVTQLPRGFEGSGNAMLKGGGEITIYSDGKCECETIPITQRVVTPVDVNFHCEPVVQNREVK